MTFKRSVQTEIILWLYAMFEWVADVLRNGFIVSLWLVSSPKGFWAEWFALLWLLITKETPDPGQCWPFSSAAFTQELLQCPSSQQCWPFLTSPLTISYLFINVFIYLFKTTELVSQVLLGFSLEEFSVPCGKWVIWTLGKWKHLEHVFVEIFPHLFQTSPPTYH